MEIKLTKEQKEYFKTASGLVSIIESKDPIFSYMGRFVYDLKHSQSEFIKHTNKPLTLWVSTLKKGINKILTEYKDEDNNYIIVHNKYKFGIVLEWRKDLYDTTGKNNGYSPTTLGSNEREYYTKNDIEIFVEQLKKIELRERKTDNIVEDINKIPYHKLEHINKIMEEYKFDMFIQSGEVKHCYNIVIV